MDSITGDSGHPKTMKQLLLSKTLLDIIDLQRPVLLWDISLHRKKKSWLSLRLVSPKRESQSKELSNWHTSLNQSKPESRKSILVGRHKLSIFPEGMNKLLLLRLFRKMALIIQPQGMELAVMEKKLPLAHLHRHGSQQQSTIDRIRSLDHLCKHKGRSDTYIMERNVPILSSFRERSLAS